jgi:hypothetical protein
MKRMRGITGFELILIGLMLNIALLLFFLIPLATLRVHLVSIVEYENKYNNALLTLLAIFPTMHDTISGKINAAQVIGNHIAIPFPVMGPALAAIKEDLKKLHKCFQLRKEDGSTITAPMPVGPLKSANCDAKNYATGKVKIALPYNPNRLVAFVELVID